MRRSLLIICLILFPGLALTTPAAGASTYNWFASGCYTSRVDCWSSDTNPSAGQWDSQSRYFGYGQPARENENNFNLNASNWQQSGDCTSFPSVGCLGGFEPSTLIPNDGFWCDPYSNNPADCLMSSGSFAWTLYAGFNESCQTGVCGAHMLAHFDNDSNYQYQSVNDPVYPFSSAFGSQTPTHPTLNVGVTQQTFDWRGSYPGGGDFHAYQCFDVVSASTGYWIEYCEENWRNDTQSGNNAPYCQGGNSIIVWNSFNSRNNYASPYATNTGARELANNSSATQTYSFSVNPSQFQAAMSAAPAACKPSDTTLSHYYLTGYEAGFESGSGSGGAGQVTQGDQSLISYDTY